MFEKTANTERFEHFAEEAELAGLVGSDAENLRDAIKGESYEIDIVYFEFAGQARRPEIPPRLLALKKFVMTRSAIGMPLQSSALPESPVLVGAVPAAVDPRSPRNALPVAPCEATPVAAALFYESSRDQRISNRGRKCGKKATGAD